MRASIYFLLAILFPALGGAKPLPAPTGYSGNLEGVRVQDVISSFSQPPDPGLAKSIEEKMKTALKTKDLFGKTNHFSILIPSLMCDVPYGKSGGEKFCHVSLTLQERVPPPGASKERIPWGIMTSYHGEYPFPFVYKKELIEEAFDTLLNDFIKQVTARRPSSAANVPNTDK